ncbi:MAG: hypothetical protein Greene041619_665 [Candidatus Peregrinibacteria bacterium Greene0416_19]|nr:MAG: hypothetical protein Greene041619_665 [Candidatus Peregrinibacteria bacterium Greene0416_19]
MPATGATGEELLAVVHEHWIKYAAPFFVGLILLMISVALFVLAGISAHHAMWLSHTSFVTGLLLLLATNHWFFAMLLSENSARIIITNKRVIHLRTRLFIHEEMKEITFEKMRFVDAKMHGLLQVLFRYGTVWFENGASLTYVPHPNRMVKQIQQAMGMK